MFQRILVPLDGSEQALEALPVAAYLARTTGASLALLRVVTPDLTYVGTYPYSWEPPELLEQTQERRQAEAHDYLSRIVLTEGLDTIHHYVQVLDGTPVPCILQFARENRIDLIVMRSHGATGIKRWLLGSVAQGIVRHSSVPALIIRDACAATSIRPPEAQHVRRILVPLDGSSLAESALLPAAQLSAALSSPAQGAIHLIETIHYIDEERDKHQELIARMNTETLTETQAYLKNIEQRFSSGDLAQFHLQVTSAVVAHANRAEIWERIIEEADGAGPVSGCDIIAMATHGRHGLERLLMGSITESVLDASTHPLLVVHAQSTEMEEEKAVETNHA
jgi:nucleotide-binding universal stress UspA family protein